MEPRTADRVEESLKAAYEAGREAARHFSPLGEAKRPAAKQPKEEPGWHH